MRTVKSNPERIREVNSEVKQLGVTVREQWATLGEFDFVSIVEAPDEHTMARVSLELGPRQRPLPLLCGDCHRGLHRVAVNAQRPEQPADPLVSTRCALSIAHARYALALRRAKEAAPGQRAARYAEARRVLETAVKLRRRAAMLEADVTRAAAEPHVPRPPRTEGSSSRLRAA